MLSPVIATSILLLCCITKLCSQYYTLLFAYIIPKAIVFMYSNERSRAVVAIASIFNISTILFFRTEELFHLIMTITEL